MELRLSELGRQVYQHNPSENGPPDPGLVTPIQSRRAKPHSGGLWTSSFINESEISAWANFCRERRPWHLTETVSYLLTPLPEARIVEIDSRRDLIALIDQFSVDDYGGLPKSFIDYQAVSEHYDAIHLTQRGELDVRGGFPIMGAWDCESTLWFRWCFSLLVENLYGD
jgi:hypothetical protein